jgi:hypothetical protein
MDSIVTVARWTARVVGTVMAAMLSVCIVIPVLFGGGDHFDPLGQLLRGKLLFATMLTTVIGLVIAPKWERIGGLLILGGLAFLVVVTGDFPPGMIFWPTLAAGLIYLACGWRRATG